MSLKIFLIKPCFPNHGALNLKLLRDRSKFKTTIVFILFQNCRIFGTCFQKIYINLKYQEIISSFVPIAISFAQLFKLCVPLSFSVCFFRHQYIALLMVCATNHFLPYGPWHMFGVNSNSKGLMIATLVCKSKKKLHSVR